jgi:fluoride exporter
MLKNILLIACGGALGSVARYIIGQFISSKYFPYGTFLVNSVGCFVIGCFMALSLKNESFTNNYKLFLITGFCGGFTTFSAFAIENLQLLQNAKLYTALTYSLLSVVVGIVCTFIGYKLIN